MTFFNECAAKVVASNPHDFITRTLWETLVLSVGIAGLHYIGKEESTL